MTKFQLNGRTVLVTDTELFEGQRPGIVVSDPTPGEVELLKIECRHANVNVFLDGTKDGETLQSMRTRPSGNTLGGVPIFEPMDSGIRAELVSKGLVRFAELTSHGK